MDTYYKYSDETQNFIIIQDFYILAERNPGLSFEALVDLYILDGYKLNGENKKFAKFGYNKYHIDL